MNNFSDLIAAIRDCHNAPTGFLPLHAPEFVGRELEYVADTIKSTFVSSVGGYVTRFESLLQAKTGARHAVACVNGTAALQVALFLAGTRCGDLVITQALSFVATANSIRHCGAEPVFLDVDPVTLGLSPQELLAFLEKECFLEEYGKCRHAETGKIIAACVPMHTFGFPCQIEKLKDVCDVWRIPIVEDAAEALGSRISAGYCGTIGATGVLSFNGNKIVTTGGGGAILTNDDAIAIRAKHLTTTAKKPHHWEFHHDELAWNYRMPNINAALGCAQLERLDEILSRKRQLAVQYSRIFADTPWTFLSEPPGAESNYWLCSVLFKNKEERDAFLVASNKAEVMTRPAWKLLCDLPHLQNCLQWPMPVARDISSRLVSLPSSVASGNV